MKNFSWEYGKEPRIAMKFNPNFEMTVRKTLSDMGIEIWRDIEKMLLWEAVEASEKSWRKFGTPKNLQSLV